ncbi:hypothetical protein [Dokdonia sp.]|uniref:hypothetical protein n=1 Tax=Dokdonia sp. TaxID=2024995 RepID=UPI003266F0B7
MRILYILLFFFCSAIIVAQEVRTKRIAIRDTIQLDSVSINPSVFKITTREGVVLDSSRYTIDYARSLLSLKAKEDIPTDTIIVTYRVYPEFLTRKYFQFDPKRIVTSSGNLDRVIRLRGDKKPRAFTPFNGLNTSGSIVRGVTVGSNQNSTVNSELDLQLSGKLSDKVTLRASIQDANIPSQEGGFSQNLDEFDQIFIELFSDNWNIRAGDINLQDTESYYGQFTKKIQGLSLRADINHSEDSKTSLFATGALVRGIFNTSMFTGQEGNQGPYKLTGPNGELFVLVVSGSEAVYANGILLERGETKDYVIDYNAGEIRFNATFPITSEMRIVVDYQFSERNFTRFVAYGGGRFRESNTLKIAAHVYSESDAKNQPLQQTLSEDQVAVLANAGDDPNQMVAQSAIPDTFSDNKVLYRQITVGGVEVFEFSIDPDETLFNVRFSNVGINQGDYILSTTNTLRRTFEYVAPINGVKQGSFEPQIRLFAPTLLQLAIVNGSYTPSEKTAIDFEVAGSKNDLNLFSNIDDENNDAFATHLKGKQQLFKKDSTATLEAFGNWDYVQEDFVNVEGLYNPEFNRDWNLDPNLQNTNGLLVGDQSFLTTGIRYQNRNLGSILYSFENLDFNTFYSGTRHSIISAINSKKIKGNINASILSTNDVNVTSDFSKLYSSAVYDLKKAWVGGKFYTEDNIRRAKVNDSLTPDSQRFQLYEGFVGVGDSTSVYVEAGYRYRVNDSVRNNSINRVNTSNTYFLKSQLLKNKKTNLSLFINYRSLSFEDTSIETQNSLNSRLLYDQRFAKDIVRLNTVFETNSGTQPQQEFTFVAVDEGQGTHTWNDYNNDGIQQLEEFEISQFQDEADFIRVLLPNQIFLQTHQNKLSSQLTLNPQQWNNSKGLRKLLSHFYNQTSYSIDRRALRQGQDFTINPFKEDENEIGLGLNLRNSLTFNRGKQKYTTTYSYLSNKSTNLLSTGLQDNELESHQFNFLHKIKESWLFNFKGDVGTTISIAENFPSRNFNINNSSINPKVSYLISKTSRVSFFYTFQDKQNTVGGQEALQQNNFGTSFAIADGEKLSLMGEFNYIDNQFDGSTFSPVSYQILEGLQPGTNFTWNLIAQKRLTKFLDLNVSYFGRKSESSRTIHTGSIQLKALF